MLFLLNFHVMFAVNFLIEKKQSDLKYFLFHVKPKDLVLCRISHSKCLDDQQVLGLKEAHHFFRQFLLVLNTIFEILDTILQNQHFLGKKEDLFYFHYNYSSLEIAPLL